MVATAAKDATLCMTAQAPGHQKNAELREVSAAPAASARAREDVGPQSTAQSTVEAAVAVPKTAVGSGPDSVHTKAKCEVAAAASAFGAAKDADFC